MSVSLQTGLKALLSAQFVLDTIGHNIANANTPGFSRQRVQLGTTLPLPRQGLLVGNGVQATEVQRTIDELLNGRIFRQVGVSGSLASQFDSMREIESLFGEPGEGSLGGLMDAFFDSVSDLSATPEDSILRSGVVQTAVSLGLRFKDLDANIAELRADRLTAINTHVQDANQLAARIADLNYQIGQTESSGAAANDLRDERDRLLRGLAEIVDVTTLESGNGMIQVLVGGNTLVGSATAHRLEATENTSGQTVLRVDGTTGFVPARGGALGGLLDVDASFVPGIRDDVDRLARNLIREVNRVHSTGIPAEGAFDTLIASSGVVDVDGDGRLTDELLSNTGLPFEVSSGDLWVNVVDNDTGAVAKHRIEISRTHTTVGDLLEELNSIPNLTADLDGFGRMRVIASAGHGFDFSNRLSPMPDPNGAFGGEAATLGTAQGPFALADGDTLDLTIDVGAGPVSFQIALDTADFDEISQATVEELAAVVNADSNAQTNGVYASVVGDQMFLHTTSTGTGTSLTVDGGSATAALGFGALVGTPVTGHSTAVDVQVQGAYTGEETDQLTFRPTIDGVVGTTDGLVVEVFNSSNELVASLDVGSGYVPGTAIDVAEGVSVSFGLGTLSASHRDAFALDLVGDSDTSDVLVALGLNSLFVGTGSKDISVRADIETDPSLLASSASGAPGDSSHLLDFLAIEDLEIEDVGGDSLGQFYGRVIGDIGFQTAITSDALESSDTLLSSLDLRRDQVSGVNVDEELVDMLQYEQAFSAASRFITVVNQLNDDLLALI